MQADLRFRADGAFTIAQFTDLHVQNGEAADAQTVALMADVLDAEQPDLAVLTGDVIDGKHSRDPAAAWRYAVAPLVERGIPWAAVFGNHDDEGGMTRAELMALQRTLPYCLSVAGPRMCPASATTCCPSAPPRRENGGDALLPRLQQLRRDPDRGYGWLRRDQIAWYLQTAQALAAANGGEPLPALAFFHIPLSEYNEAWDLHVCYGHKFEPVCCPLINTGFYAALHEAGDVMGTFVGHDHVNDFVGDLYGIRLCYGRATGFNTYGRQGFTRGAADSTPGRRARLPHLASAGGR